MKKILILFLFANQFLFSSPLVIDGSKEFYKLSPFVKFLEDRSNTLTIEDVQNLSNNFQTNQGDYINFGITDSAYWLSIEYEFINKPDGYLLELEYPLLGEVSFYYINMKGELIKKVTGSNLPFALREIEHRNILFSLRDIKSKGKFFFRVKTLGIMEIPLSIYKQNFFWEKEQRFFLIQILFLGIIGSMVLYNTLLGISLTDKAYFFYIFYVISLALFQTSLNGISYQFFWKDSVYWNQVSLPVFISLSNIGISALIISFLKLKTNLPYTYQIFRLTILISIVCILSSFYVTYIKVITFAIFITIVSSLLSIFTAFAIAKKGYRPAKIYVFAGCIFLLGALLIILNRLHFISANILTDHLTEFGIALESILISFALVDRVKIIEEEKEKAQSESIESLKKTLQIESELNVFKNEMELAQKIQRSMIPNKTPQVEGLTICAWYKPMESVGGDFYDFQIKGGYLGFIIADVSGHGVPAALIVSTFKTAFWFQEQMIPKPTFWFQEQNLPKPEELLSNMNSILRGKSGGEFVTACYGYIDIKRKILKTGNAGHSDLLIYRNKKSKLYSLNPKGAALCVFKDPEFESDEFQLEKGDRIFVYTDGLFEVRDENDQLFGEARLLEILKNNSQLSASEFGEHILSTVNNWARQSNSLEDDIALIVIDVTN